MTWDTQQQFAWAVGLFEGEGYCGVMNRKLVTEHNRCPHFRMSLGMTDRDVIVRLHAVMGCGRLEGPVRRLRSKPMWVWVCSKRADLERLLPLMLPHLGGRRQQQLQAVLNALRDRPAVRVIPPRSSADCGARSKSASLDYGRHIRRGEAPCQRCTDRWRRYQQRMTARRNQNA